MQEAVLLRRSLRRLQPFCLLFGYLGVGVRSPGAVLLLPDFVGEQVLHSAW